MRRKCRQNGEFMGKRINNYLVFTSIPYRIIMFVGLPVLVLLLLFWSRSDIFMGLLCVFLFYTSIEVVGDNWVFGGIAVKSGSCMEYFKGSAKRGMVLKNALLVNMLRYFCEIVLWLVIGLVFSSGRVEGEPLNGKQFIICANLALVTYFIMTMELIIARMLEGAIMGLAVAAIGSLLQLGVYYLAVGFYGIMLPVLIALSVLISVASVKFAGWRMKESFYDKAD